MTAPVNDAPPGDGGEPQGGGGGVLGRRVGNFPLWVWIGLGLAGLLAYSSYKKNKTAQQTTAQSGTLPTTQTASGSTPASLIPQFVNQVYDNPTPPVVNVTTNSTTPVNVTNNIPTAPSPTPTPAPPPPARPPAAPPPPPTPAPPAGQWVTVGVWNSTNAPWNSTLWGIAQHVYGNGALYPKIFAANKQGVMRPDGTAGPIANPNLVYPGERIWVPA